MAAERRPSFDSKTFLARVRSGQSIRKCRKDQVVFSQGEPADAVRLLRDIENVSKLYRSRGYMLVQVKPDTQFDDDKGAVHYDLNVVEGDLYKMGELEILGLDTQTTAHMRAAWPSFQGR